MRCYAEPVDVHRQDTTPDQFLWRGRLYVVRDVLAHWMEAGGWWRRPTVGVDDREREFWRVEAGSGRHAMTGVYDLCFDWGHAAWSVARVLD
jgi:hypothetical protein